MWYLGQKVVCINKSYYGKGGNGNLPLEKDRVYTIRSIFTAQHFGAKGKVLFQLYEIVNRQQYNHLNGTFEPGYHEINFRPLVTKITDISIFTEMLNQKELENV